MFPNSFITFIITASSFDASTNEVGRVESYVYFVVVSNIYEIVAQYIKHFDKGLLRTEQCQANQNYDYLNLLKIKEYLLNA